MRTPPRKSKVEWLVATFVATLLVVPPEVFAHPGHGLDGAGLAHFALDLSHGGAGLVVILLLAAAVVGRVATQARRRS